MRVHFLSGYTILTLLLFRFGWGIIGSHPARFATFVKGPRAALEHLRELRLPPDQVPPMLGLSAACGHNQRRHRSRPRQIDFKEMAAPTSEEVNHRTRARSTWPLSVICTGMR
jgi:hypothetical protein